MKKRVVVVGGLLVVALGALFALRGGDAKVREASANASAAAPVEEVRHWSANPHHVGTTLAGGTQGARLIDDVYADAVDLCIGEPVTVTTIPNASHGPLRVLSAGRPENPAVFSFAAAGKQQIVVSADDGVGASEVRMLDLDVHECDDFHYVAVKSEKLPSLDAYAFTAKAVFAKTETPEPADALSYDWEFGDGSVEHTSRPAVEHDFAARAQTTASSSFVVKVTATSKTHGTLTGATSLLIDNIAFRNRQAGKTSTPMALVGTTVADGRDFAFPIELRNYDPGSVSLDSAHVDMVPCAAKSDEAPDTFKLGASEVLDTTTLAPGVTKTTGHVRGHLAGAKYCRALVTMEGKAADGMRARTVFGVELRAPANAPGARVVDERMAASDPEAAKQLARLRAAYAALGKNPQTDRLTDAELRRLEREGVLPEAQATR